MNSILLICLVYLVVTGQAHAYSFQPAGKHGAVYSQAVVYDDNGDPVFVEYGTDGSIVNTIGPAAGDLEDAIVMSRQQYNAIVDAYKIYLTQEEQGAALGATVLSRDAYSTASFVTLANEPVTKPDLKGATKSVLVRGQETLLIQDLSPILFESTIDLNGLEDQDLLADDIVSVLVNSDGQTVQFSQYNIGFHVAYRDDEEDNFIRKYSSNLYAPIAGVGIDAYVGGRDVKSVTMEDGKYTMSYILSPCPGFDFWYTGSLYARLNFKNFSPMGSKNPQYVLFSRAYDYCIGSHEHLLSSGTLGGLAAYSSVVGILATSSTTSYNNDFKVDTMMLTGKGNLKNGSQDVALGPTEYKHDSAEKKIIAQSEYDFDKDGIADTAVLGVEVELDLVVDIEEELDDQGNVIVAEQGGDGTGDLDTNTHGEVIKYFKAQEQDATVQAIFLSSALSQIQIPAEGDEPTLENQPHFTRLADLESDLEHQGLLSSISEEDLKNTDLYVFRVSNGDLITERIGLKTEEVINFNQGGVDGDKIYYQVLMRGPDSRRPPYGPNFQQWQAKSQINPELHERDADHLRPGERVKVIAINRASGYIGSVVTTLTQTGTAGDITVPVEDIEMKPPNLKIRATRHIEIEAGITKGEEKDYLVGFEGGGLKTDQYIAIDTEWLDHDGTPLPEELADYGYTGRLAKVVSENVLGEAGNGVAHFEVEPGKHLQLVKLSEEELLTEHYYVQVNGLPTDRSPDFSTLGAGAGILAHRPKNYVPFLVPVYDESTSLKLKKALNAYKLTLTDQEITVQEESGTLDQPDAYYEWIYRPEMQFTVYDMDVSEIKETLPDGTVLNVYDFTDPLLNFNDRVEVLYSLLTTMLESLPTFSHERQLTISLGNIEVGVTVDENGNVIFDDLTHLQLLKEDDFVLLSLYLNNDPENLLWEFEFKKIDIDVDSNNDNDFNDPDVSEEEDIHENIIDDKDHPGKILYVNYGEVEDFDPVDNPEPLMPNYARFTSGDPFVPIKVNIGNYFDLQTDKLRFVYSGSDPMKVEKIGTETIGYNWVPDAGHLRVWTKNGDEERIPESLIAGGHYIPDEVLIPISSLGYTETKKEVTLYVESVNLSEKPGDVYIKVEVIEE